MATLTKTQFKEQLKNPEVATIKRNIRLFRKTIRPYSWGVISRNDKRYKYFKLIIAPRVYDFNNYNSYWEERHYDKVYEILIHTFKGIGPCVFSDTGDMIEVSIPYNRPKD